MSPLVKLMRSIIFLNPDTDVTDVTILNELHRFLETHPKVGIVALVCSTPTAICKNLSSFS